MSDTTKYPLSDHGRHSLQSYTNKSIDQINIENLANGDLDSNDLRIHADSLISQAKIARQSGFDSLADNLERAAELTVVPNDLLLSFYEALRPGRSTLSELESLAVQLEQEFNATRCANFVREAAATYEKRTLLKADQ